MTDPRRVERHWLALAVGTLWCVSVGGDVDAQAPVSTLEALPPTHIARRTKGQRQRRRVLSCFQQGLLAICDALSGSQTIADQSLPAPTLARCTTTTTTPMKKPTLAKPQPSPVTKVRSQESY